MKFNGLSLFMILLASSLVVPMGFSQAQVSNQTTITNQTITTNATVTVNKTSSTVSANQTEETEANAFAQQVSDFVHQAVADFKKQRDETFSAIQDCHQKLQNAAPADKDKIKADCRATLDSIKQKYQDERKHFKELFQEFRESIKTLRMDAKGMHVEKADTDKALGDIKEMKKKMHGEMGKGSMGMGH